MDPRLLRQTLLRERRLRGGGERKSYTLRRWNRLVKFSRLLESKTSTNAMKQHVEGSRSIKEELKKSGGQGRLNIEMPRKLSGSWKLDKYRSRNAHPRTGQKKRPEEPTKGVDKNKKGFFVDSKKRRLLRKKCDGRLSPARLCQLSLELILRGTTDDHKNLRPQPVQAPRWLLPHLSLHVRRALCGATMINTMVLLRDLKTTRLPTRTTLAPTAGRIRPGIGIVRCH